MATKYWVGGAGTWNATTATNWSDTSGGPGGALAPCALDDVVFNSASNATAYTVTISDGAVCKDITVAGPASGNVTLGGSGSLYVYGNLSFAATGITRTWVGLLYFSSKVSGNTITLNGLALAQTVTFDGVGGGWTFGSAFNNGSSNISLINGTVDTAGYAVTCGALTATSGSSALNLGASSVSVSTNISQFSSQFCSLNAGTSTITLSSSAAASNIGSSTHTGSTFYNVTFTSSSKSATIIYGANTFNNLTFTTPVSVGSPCTITFAGNQTITGTLTATGSGAINRYMLLSDAIGTARTLTVGTVATLTDVDFRDITVAGASSPWSGTRLGDCGGNTNITFGAGATKYWNLLAGGAWTAAAWATSSGGTADVLNFPLAQDNVVIDNTGLNTSASITGFSGYNVKTLDCSTRSNAATLSGTSARINDDLTLSTSMTVSGLSVLFEGRTTQTITSAGRTLGAITVNNSGSSATLADAFNGTTLTLTAGTFTTNNQSVTLTGTVSVSGTQSKTFTLGSSAISCTTFASSVTSGSNVTVSAGTSSITCTTAGSAAFGFDGITSTFYNVTCAPAPSTINFYGTNTFNNLTLNAQSNFGVSTITLYGSLTVNGTLAFGGGASVIQRVMCLSSVIGTQRTITAAAVTGLTDIDFRDIQGAGAANWATGTRLGDCGGNTGITFPVAKTVYWNLTGIQNWSATAWATSSGGAPAANNFPLAQDTAIFDNTGAISTVTIEASWNIGTISAGGRTSAWTLAGSGAAEIYGDITYGSGITASVLAAYTFRKNGTQIFTTAGKNIQNALYIRHPNCVFKHGDACTGSSGTIIAIYDGSYETQNFAITTGQFAISTPASSSTRSVNLGSSTITLSGSSPINMASVANLTFNAGTSTINLSSGSNKTVDGRGLTFYNVSNTGGTNTTWLRIRQSNTFNTLTNTARQDLWLESGSTQTFTTFSYSGASGSVIDIYTTIPGSQAILKKASGAWFAGANSTDGGNNVGWTFTAGGSTDYAYIKDIIASTASTGTFFLMF